MIKISLYSIVAYSVFFFVQESVCLHDLFAGDHLGVDREYATGKQGVHCTLLYP
jgi:hypothetical protein